MLLLIFSFPQNAFYDNEITVFLERMGYTFECLLSILLVEISKEPNPNDAIVAVSSFEPVKVLNQFDMLHNIGILIILFCHIFTLIKDFDHLELSLENLEVAAISAHHFYHSLLPFYTVDSMGKQVTQVSFLSCVDSVISTACFPGSHLIAGQLIPEIGTSLLIIWLQQLFWLDLSLWLNIFQS